MFNAPDMKKAGFLFVLLSLLIFSGCHDDEDYNIVLGANEINVLAGGEAYVRIYYPGSLSIANDNSDIAYSLGSTNENDLIIETLKVGTASIRLIDEHDPSKQAQLIVHCHYLGGVFEEVAVPPANAVFVSATDKDIEDQIREELSNQLKESASTRYEFDSSTNRVTIDFSRSAGGGGSVEGTYQWEPAGNLTLSCNGITESYGFTIIGEHSKSYPVEGKALLISRLTEEYKERYPEAGVMLVGLDRVLSGSFDFE